MGRTLRSKLLSLATATIFTTSFLYPNTISAVDEGYIEYSPTSREEVLEVLSKNNFPESFDFYYEIAPNKKGFTGNFRLIHSRDKTDLRIRIIHPNADKSFNFYEERKGDKVYYHESEFDYPQNRLLYDTTFVYSIKEKPKTLVSLIEMASVGEISNTSFVFHGGSRVQNKYNLKVISISETNFDLELKGEISKNSPRIPWMVAFYEDFFGVKVPTEVWISYKVKIFNAGIFGNIYVTPKIKSTLKMPDKR